MSAEFTITAEMLAALLADLRAALDGIKGGCA